MKASTATLQKLSDVLGSTYEPSAVVLWHFVGGLKSIENHGEKSFQNVLKTLESAYLYELDRRDNGAMVSVQGETNSDWCKRHDARIAATREKYIGGAS